MSYLFRALLSSISSSIIKKLLKKTSFFLSITALESLVEGLPLLHVFSSLLHYEGDIENYLILTSHEMRHGKLWTTEHIRQINLFSPFFKGSGPSD